MDNSNHCCHIKKDKKHCQIKIKYYYDDKYYCTRHMNLLKLDDKETYIIDDETVEHKNDTSPPENNNDDVDFTTELLDYFKTKLTDYHIIKYLSKGVFGMVYLIECSIDNKEYALKLVYHKNTKNIKIDDKRAHDSIYYEYMLLLNHLNNHDSIIKMKNNIYKKFITKNYTFSIIILDYCRYTLDEYIKEHTMDEYKIKKIGTYLVDIMSYIHSKSYIYIDLKPENIMFQNDNIDSIKLIDFGLAERYINTTGIIKQKKYSCPVGTTIFSSIFSNSCKTSNRMGDLQSIGYILLWLNHNLPWTVDDTEKNILQTKKKLLTNKIFIDRPEYIKKFITKTYIKSEFGDRPDYVEFMNILK